MITQFISKINFFRTFYYIYYIFFSLRLTYIREKSYNNQSHIECRMQKEECRLVVEDLSYHIIYSFLRKNRSGSNR